MCVCVWGGGELAGPGCVHGCVCIREYMCVKLCTHASVVPRPCLQDRNQTWIKGLLSHVNSNCSKAHGAQNSKTNKGFR